MFGLVPGAWIVPLRVELGLSAVYGQRMWWPEVICFSIEDVRAQTLKPLHLGSMALGPGMLSVPFFVLS